MRACGAGERISRANQEQLDLRQRGEDKDSPISTIYSFPAAVATLRGQGGDLIILEEAGFMDQVRAVCSPLMFIPFLTR